MGVCGRQRGGEDNRKDEAFHGASPLFHNAAIVAVISWTPALRKRNLKDQPVGRIRVFSE
jgi:hypothetical protein